MGLATTIPTEKDCVVISIARGGYEMSERRLKTLPKSGDSQPEYEERIPLLSQARCSLRRGENPSVDWAELAAPSGTPAVLIFRCSTK